MDAMESVPGKMELSTEKKKISAKAAGLCAVRSRQRRGPQRGMFGPQDWAGQVRSGPPTAPRGLRAATSARLTAKRFSPDQNANPRLPRAGAAQRARQQHLVRARPR